MTLATSFYGRRHAASRRRLYNAWRGPQGVSALRQRVLQTLGVDEDGNTTIGIAELVCTGMRTCMSV